MSPGFLTFLVLVVFVIFPAALLGLGAPLIVILTGFVFLTALLAYFGLYQAPSLTGVVILNRLNGKLSRWHGPGYFFIVPGMESVAHEIPLSSRSAKFTTELETGGKESVPVGVSFEYKPGYLVNLVRFGGGDLKVCFEMVETALKERLKSIAVPIIVGYRNRKAVMANLQLIAETIKRGFENAKTEDGKMKLQEYYGINLLATMLVEVELPEELKKKIAEREAVKEENKIRAAKMKKTREMALAIIKAAIKLYGDPKHPGVPSFDEAMKIVQIIEKMVEKRITEFSIDKHTGLVAEGILTKILSGVLKGGGNGKT